jgi:hypothetical protein
MFSNPNFCSRIKDVRHCNKRNAIVAQAANAVANPAPSSPFQAIGYQYSAQASRAGFIGDDRSEPIASRPLLLDPGRRRCIWALRTSAELLPRRFPEPSLGKRWGKNTVCNRLKPCRFGVISATGLLAQIQPRLNRRPPVASGTYCAGLPLTFAAAASSWEISRTSRAYPKGLRASRRQEASKYGQALPEQARIGPVRLCARHRAARFDLGRKAQGDEKRTCEHGRCKDGVYRLAHDT